MNPKRKEKERQVPHLPYVSTNQKFCIDNYHDVKNPVLHLSTFWCSNFFYVVKMLKQ